MTLRPQPGNAGWKLYPAQEAPRGSTELPSFFLLETPELIFLYGLVNPLAHPQSIHAHSRGQSQRGRGENKQEISAQAHRSHSQMVLQQPAPPLFSTFPLQARGDESSSPTGTACPCRVSDLNRLGGLLYLSLQTW